MELGLRVARIGVTVTDPSLPDNGNVGSVICLELGGIRLHLSVLIAGVLVLAGWGNAAAVGRGTRLLRLPHLRRAALPGARESPTLRRARWRRG